MNYYETAVTIEKDKEELSSPEKFAKYINLLNVHIVI